MAVTLSLRPQHLGRYRDLARLLVKYGRSDVVHRVGLDAALVDTDPLPAGSEEDARDLAADLERMGPTFIKLGQLLSTRSDLLPPAYIKALARLQDHLEPFPYEQVEDIVGTELGVRLSKVYSWFDRRPVAAASLGQVHRAALRDGRPVVVKVQRPGIRRQVFEDLDVLAEVAEFLEDHTEHGQAFAFGDLLDRFRRSLVDELDYRTEASNLVRLGAIVAARRHLVVPQPYDDFTSGRVLTMEYVEGRKVTDLSPLARLDIDGRVLAEDLFRAYLDQILVEGFFHADPHPGNVLLTPDGRLGLIDVGMVARVTPDTRSQLIRLLLAVAEHRGEEVARLAADMSTPLEGFDEPRFTSQVAELVDRSADRRLGEIDAGAVVLELTRVCGNSGLRPPSDLTMVGKALLNLDQVARLLDPGFEPISAVQDHAVALVRSGLLPSVSGVVGAMMDAKDFAEQLPGRVNRTFDALSDGRFELRVQAFDETEFLRGLHKMANRVAMGVVLAALLIGAALMSRVPTRSTILGYPSVAFIFFILAAIGGIGLVVTIVLSDRRIRSRRGPR